MTAPPRATGASARVAIVTGGARGIGWATVEAFARDGIVPVLFDRDREALARADEALARRGIAHSVHGLDIADEAAVDAAVEQTVAQHGRLDILVNNAGIAIRKPTLELSRADWQAVVDVNLTAVFLCCRAAAKHMLPAGGGAIVNVASIFGLSGGGAYPNLSYQASKGAIVNLTRALGIEWATRGIRVNAVAPSWVRTDLTEKLFQNEELVQKLLELVPMRRMPEPSDIAEAIAFLASDRARFITGHTLPVDAGFLAQ